MILAAGLGTRLKPWTNEHPKALAPVNGKPLLQRNIEYLQSFGIEDIVVNIHHFADQIVEAVRVNNGWGSRVQLVHELPNELETGGGLKNAAKYLEGAGDFVLMNADILTDLDLTLMIENHKHTKPIATLATTNRVSSRHLLFNESNVLCGWENETTGQKRIARSAEAFVAKAFSGVHVINDGIFPLMRQEGKFSIIDTYLELAEVKIIKAFDHSGGKLVDVGKPENIALAESLFQ